MRAWGFVAGCVLLACSRAPDPSTAEPAEPVQPLTALVAPEQPPTEAALDPAYLADFDGIRAELRTLMESGRAMSDVRGGDACPPRQRVLQEQVARIRDRVSDLPLAYGREVLVPGTGAQDEKIALGMAQASMFDCVGCSPERAEAACTRANLYLGEPTVVPAE